MKIKLCTFGLRYQPIMSLVHMRTESVEVLVRGVGEHGQEVGPEKILREMTGCEESTALTAKIIHRALSEYLATGFDPLGPSFAFNLPLDAMLHPDLLGIIEELRHNSGLPAHVISFELTERHVVHDIALVGQIVSQLRHAGYTMALDDVTPHMPNLQALVALPFQSIKLDRSVTTSKAAADHQFMSRIAKHATANAQLVVAEGIETQAHLQQVRNLGVGYGQGFLFAEPLCPQDLKRFLAAGNVPPKVAARAISD